MPDQFVSEPIVPVKASMSATSVATGTSSFPKRFFWRDRDCKLDAGLDERKESGRAREGDGERHLRKHWLRMKTTDATVTQSTRPAG